MASRGLCANTAFHLRAFLGIIYLEKTWDVGHLAKLATSFELDRGEYRDEQGKATRFRQRNV